MRSMLGLVLLGACGSATPRPPPQNEVQGEREVRVYAYSGHELEGLYCAFGAELDGSSPSTPTIQTMVAASSRCASSATTATAPP